MRITGRRGERRTPLTSFVALSLSHLLLVLTPGGIQRLDECSGMADEHGVTGGPHDHTQHRQPDVSHAFGRLLPVADAQHVAHGLEEGVGVLFSPRVVL